MASFVAALKIFAYFCGKERKTMDARLKTTLQEYFAKQPVLKAWVFGSFSRDEENEDSDVDIMVVLDDSQQVGLKFFAMLFDLKELLGREVDLVTEDSLLPFARESANRDRILVYERAA